jgi:hypothetical protein
MIKASNYQEVITINIHTPNDRAQAVPETKDDKIENSGLGAWLKCYSACLASSRP